MLNHNKRVWITWESQVRNRSMSKLLNAHLYELNEGGSRFRMYRKLIPRTLKIIIQEKPDELYTQNPSIVLSFLALLIRPFFKYKLIIDEHNSGLYPMEGKSRFLNQICKLIARNADVAIVSNDNLASIVKNWGGRPMIIPDPLPDIQPSKNLKNKSEKIDIFTFVFICTWSKDEPFNEVIEAARKINENDVQILITGKPKNNTPKDIPNNVILTGFLAYQDYIDTIYHSDATIVLTRRENCLNCGAYESVQLEKPGILSDTMALRSYFKKGFLFTNNSRLDLVEKINELIINEKKMKKLILALKKEMLKEEGSTFNTINADLTSNQ